MNSENQQICPRLKSLKKLVCGCIFEHTFDQGIVSIKDIQNSSKSVKLQQRYLTFLTQKWDWLAHLDNSGNKGAHCQV